jgi:hypothetical protein
MKTYSVEFFTTTRLTQKIHLRDLGHSHNAEITVCTQGIGVLLTVSKVGNILFKVTVQHYGLLSI